MSEPVEDREDGVIPTCQSCCGQGHRVQNGYHSIKFRSFHE